MTYLQIIYIVLVKTQVNEKAVAGGQQLEQLIYLKVLILGAVM